MMMKKKRLLTGNGKNQKGAGVSSAVCFAWEDLWEQVQVKWGLVRIRLLQIIKASAVLELVNSRCSGGERVRGRRRALPSTVRRSTKLRVPKWRADSKWSWRCCCCCCCCWCRGRGANFCSCYCELPGKGPRGHAGTRKMQGWWLRLMELKLTERKKQQRRLGKVMLPRLLPVWQWATHAGWLNLPVLIYSVVVILLFGCSLLLCTSVQSVKKEKKEKELEKRWTWTRRK